MTNDPVSELADAAEITVALHAGPERAVAATKTYVNQLAPSRCLPHPPAAASAISDALRRTAGLLAETVEASTRPAEEAAPGARLRPGRLFAIGRGVEFATAREIALKLTETCRIAAEPLTTTDLSHGPVAALDALFPVWAVATRDPCLPVSEAARRARASGAALIASDAADEVEGAALSLPVPPSPVAVLSPLLSIVPGQLVAGALAVARGLDPDRPVGLEKVTLAA